MALGLYFFFITSHGVEDIVVDRAAFTALYYGYSGYEYE